MVCFQITVGCQYFIIEKQYISRQILVADWVDDWRRMESLDEGWIDGVENKEIKR